jgi:hypothetical protein
LSYPGNDPAALIGWHNHVIQDSTFVADRNTILD